jgi:hypothetical protein
MTYLGNIARKHNGIAKHGRIATHGGARMHRNIKAQGTTRATKYKNNKSTTMQRNISEHMNNETHKNT